MATSPPPVDEPWPAEDLSEIPDVVMPDADVMPSPASSAKLPRTVLPVVVHETG